MSEEANKLAMGRFFEDVYNQGNVALFDELAAPDFVSHDTGNPTHDRDGVKRIVGAIWAAFPDVRFTADDILADGDKVVARFTMRGTQRGDFMGIPATNKQLTVTGIDIVRFLGDKAVEHWHEWSGLELMQQLGVMQRHPLNLSRPSPCSPRATRHRPARPTQDGEPHPAGTRPSATSRRPNTKPLPRRPKPRNINRSE
jgi:steroid delta-isomerase-like uncharacterized protein